MSELIYPPGGGVVVTQDGETLPVGPKRLSPSEIVHQLQTIVSMPYLGDDPELIGMTLLEAGMYAAAREAARGDVDALNKILDRLVGKPIQQIVSASGTLKEFLDGIARTDTPAAADPDPLSD